MSAQLPVEVRWVKAPEAETREDRDLVERTAREIIEAVRSRGDDAVREYSGKLDGWTPERFRVSREEIERATGRWGRRAQATSSSSATRSESSRWRNWPA